MPDDPSHRELAAFCLAMAERASGLRDRASLLKIAQKWHDLAEIDERDAARLRAVQLEIGRELRTLQAAGGTTTPDTCAAHATR
jgi:hypothetical protein